MRTLIASGLIAIVAPIAAAQAPDVDIFLVSLKEHRVRCTLTLLADGTARDECLPAQAVRNLTARAGYDNQPSWSRDGKTLFFTSVREGEQADIYRMDPVTGMDSRVTLTSPESEYSATPMPGHSAVSVIRVERDSTQRLWSVPLDGSAGAVIVGGIKPVGYHTWVNDTLLALFVLGSPNTLQLASTRSGRGDTITTSIGRSLHTTKDGQVSFVHKVSAEEWWLTLLNPATKAQTRLVRMPRRVEDYSWLPDGRVLAGEGSVLKVFDPKKGGEWGILIDLAPNGVTGITRLAVSPNGDAVAVVAQAASSGRDLPR